MHVLLSLCEKTRSSYQKRPCFENLCSVFTSHQIYVLEDDLSQDMQSFIISFNNVQLENKVGGKDRYMIDKFEFCYNNFESNNTIYMIEDDYMHHSGSDVLLEEGNPFGFSQGVFDINKC